MRDSYLLQWWRPPPDLPGAQQRRESVALAYEFTVRTVKPTVDVLTAVFQSATARIASNLHICECRMAFHEQY